MQITVLGAGTIGLSWVRRFVAGGHTVTVCDPRPDLADVLATLPLTDSERGRVRIETDRAAALAAADLVQESGPEHLPFKRELLADFAEHGRPEALWFSSSSALLPSDMTADAPDEVAARVAIGHPFNPPHLMPLVEVVPGARTAATTLDAARAFYTELGMEPAVLMREVPGFVGNRLQKAIWAEAFGLVVDGVVSVEDLDTVMKNSLGLRCACVGIVEAAAMGGGAAGVQGLMDLLRESFANIELGDIDWSNEALAPLYEAAEAAYGKPARPELIARRDELLTGVLKVRGQLA